MNKLYVVRHFIMASGIRDAVKKTSGRAPDEVYVADEWINKVGYIPQENIETRGFKEKK